VSASCGVFLDSRFGHGSGSDSRARCRRCECYRRMGWGDSPLCPGRPLEKESQSGRIPAVPASLFPAGGGKLPAV
jgi:hypothetical protein